MNQDMSYQAPGDAVGQEDPMTGSGNDDDDDDDDQRSDPGCQNDLDRQEGNLELDEDQVLGDMQGIDSGSDEGQLPPSQQQTEGQTLNLNLAELAGLVKLDNLKVSMTFIQQIASASLDDEHSGLDSSVLERIRNPPTSIPPISDDPGMRLGLEIFLALTNAAQGTYTTVCNAILRRYPDDEIPSYDQVRKYISDITGVFSVAHDMCINSCLAYTGPFRSLTNCPECAEG
jgi:hypothetical protein